MSQSVVDPASLSASASDSPSPSSSQSPAPSSPGQPPRKRPRLSEPTTSEEKKLARAERNRIAAQESRDRRKREFSDLHKRVTELEAENAALRQSTTGATTGNERTLRLERENAELLERVVKLEAALTNMMPLILGSHSSSSVPQAPVPKSSPVSLPSFDSTDLSTRTDASSSLLSDSTRHSARVATIPTPSLEASVMPQQRVDPSTLTLTPSVSTSEPSIVTSVSTTATMAARTLRSRMSPYRQTTPSMIPPYPPTSTSFYLRLRSHGRTRLLMKIPRSTMLRRTLSSSLMTQPPKKRLIHRQKYRRR